MTGMSIPHPHALGSCTSHGSGAGEEIVHSWRKRRGSVNPLVVGSNPTGPTTFRVSVPGTSVRVSIKRRSSHFMVSTERPTLAAQTLWFPALKRTHDGDV